MKKISTLLLVGALAGTAHAQVTTLVLEPANLAGAYESTFATLALSWELTPDMTDPANAVTDTLALAYDGTTADSLCCESVVNTSEVAGKIAVIYRGTCNYSIKAYNCQQAGAVAVLLINNAAGAPAGMSGAVNSELVDIPVFQIRQDDGATLRAAMDAGTTVVARLGNAAGFFANELAIENGGLLMPPSAAMPTILAQNASEYTTTLGAWVHNNGTANATGATLTVDVTQSGSSVWNEISDPVDIPAGDSAFIEAGDFSQPTYSGQYSITYTAANPAGEEYPLNNSLGTTLTFGDDYGYAPVDEVTGIPVSQAAVMPNPRTGSFTYCVHFRDANASRVAATGMQVLAAMNATTAPDPPATLDGKLFTITALEWQDEFTGISDAAFDIATLEELALADYIIEEDTNLWRGFIPFTQPVVLQDNVRYLFCLTNVDLDVFLGSDDVSYDTNEEVRDQPTTPEQNGTEWRIGLIGTVSSNTVQMIDVNTIGIAEHAAAVEPAFPNPTRDELRIPLSSLKGTAHVRIMDRQGAVVNDQVASATGRQLVVNTQGLAAGAYTFEVTTEDGQRSSFKVVISR